MQTKSEELSSSPRTREIKAPKAARLVELAGLNVGQTFAVENEIIIGRDLNCSVQILSPHISRQHARIWQNDNGEFVLEDMQSRNGTLLNGTRIQQATLTFGDKIQLASDTVFMFTYYDRLAEHLLQSQKMESIGRLASGIAHDFNNLLGAVLSNFAYLETVPNSQTFGEGDIRDCLQEMKTATQRAVGLTRQLLDFSKPARVAKEIIELSLLSHEVIQFIRRNFDPSIRIEAQIEPNLVVLGDPSRLHQVLTNLCFNARDAMPDGGLLSIKIQSINIEQTPSLDIPIAMPGKSILITVADTGIGMDEETRKRAFEPFFTTKSSGEGTGLGLSIVYGAIRSHGGHIDVESSPKKGAIFRIFLPAHQKDATGRETLAVVSSDWDNKLPDESAPIPFELDEDEITQSASLDDEPISTRDTIDKKE